MLKAVVLIETLILILLVFLFFPELTTIGSRIYLIFRESPEMERRIGDYYHYTAKLNQTYANLYYEKAVNGYNLHLNGSPAKNQITHLKAGLARMYECGRGVKQNLQEAARLYGEALQAEGANSVKLQESLDRIKKAQTQNSGLTISCEQGQESYHIEWKWLTSNI